MARTTLHGVYRRNTRGRAYIISRSDLGAWIIFRCSAKLPLVNGEPAFFSGVVQDGWLFPERIASLRPPRRNEFPRMARSA